MNTLSAGSHTVVCHYGGQHGGFNLHLSELLTRDAVGDCSGQTPEGVEGVELLPLCRIYGKTDSACWTVHTALHTSAPL